MDSYTGWVRSPSHQACQESAGFHVSERRDKIRRGCCSCGGANGKLAGGSLGAWLLCVTVVSCLGRILQLRTRVLCGTNNLSSSNDVRFGYSVDICESPRPKVCQAFASPFCPVVCMYVLINTGGYWSRPWKAGLYRPSEQVVVEHTESRRRSRSLRQARYQRRHCLQACPVT
jgi:hypothetical protein